MAINQEFHGFTFGRSFSNAGCCYCNTATKGSFNAYASNGSKVVKVAVQCCPKCRDAGTIAVKLDAALDAAASQGFTKMVSKPEEVSSPVQSDSAPSFKLTII
jgi:spore coat protein U-like protein